MFSIQLHITINTSLGQRLPLIQHIVGAAMVNALKSHPLYKVSLSLITIQVLISNWFSYQKYPLKCLKLQTPNTYNRPILISIENGTFETIIFDLKFVVYISF